MSDELAEYPMPADGSPPAGGRPYHRPQAPMVAGTVAGLTQNDYSLIGSDGPLYSYPY